MRRSRPIWPVSSCLSRDPGGSSWKLRTEPKRGDADVDASLLGGSGSGTTSDDVRDVAAVAGSRTEVPPL